MSPTKRKNTSTSTTSNKKPTKVQIQPFVAKLYHMLNSTDEKVRSIVTWLDPIEDNEEATFIIRNSQLFSQNVIPLYFGCNLQSFKRQLNYYGFERVNNNDSHQHSNLKKRSHAIRYRHGKGKFQFGREDLLYEIHRSTCNDPRIQMDYLRDKVSMLDSENESLKNQVSLLQTKMQEMCEEITKLSSNNFHLSSNGLDQSGEQHKTKGSLHKVNAYIVPRTSSGCNRQHSLAFPPVDDKNNASLSGLDYANLDLDLCDDRRDPSLGLLRLGSVMAGGISRAGSIDQYDWEGLRDLLGGNKRLTVTSVVPPDIDEERRVQIQQI
eukprot:CAMPEP_0116061530 /NCGR_PEP_ID=MMETSP0322-20121206/7144_1 /TAXON_ID=163516 /ORGANISM="Leptocylindrus danicus var. apora, Strain B651" /LENGTH=322 /DNA_ID=CAMNT_0003546515 /DNA_START=43 /DNA_END=1011 /DNA_ORIENTATION=+